MKNIVEKKVIVGKEAEKWKKIKFQADYISKRIYYISNYGRVRSQYQEEEELRLKMPLIYKERVIYKFTFPKSLNGGQKLILHVEAKNLVAQHFSKNYYKGCYVLWKDYNRFNNYIKNILCLEPSSGRSHAAKGRYITVKQTPVIPPAPQKKQVNEEANPHRIEPEYDYFKIIPGFSKYEINRYGVIRKATSPNKGRIMKQRMHPDKFYLLDLVDDQKAKRSVYVHKAVASAWNINVLPEKRTVVIHKDGDSLNNFSDNLEWVDQSEALKHHFALNQRDNSKSWKTRKKKYGNSGRKKNLVKQDGSNSCEHYDLAKTT